MRQRRLLEDYRYHPPCQHAQPTRTLKRQRRDPRQRKRPRRPVVCLSRLRVRLALMTRMKKRKPRPRRRHAFFPLVRRPRKK